MNAGTAAPNFASLSNSLGPFFVGSWFSLFLSGLITAQGSLYFRLYPKGADRVLFRYGVAFLMGMDIATSAFACVSVYILGITRWGDTSDHLAPFGFAMQPICNGITTLVVQTFYAYRVYVISRSWIIPAFIILLSFVQMGFSIGGTVIVFTLPANEWLPKFKYGVCIWLFSALAGDLIISASIVYYLRKARNESKFATSGRNSVLTQIIRLTLENNSLTAFCAFFDAMLFLFLKNNWHVLANIVLLKLYIISFVFSLTARAKFTGGNNIANACPTQAGSSNTHRIGSTPISGAIRTMQRLARGGESGNPLSVHVTVESMQSTDEVDNYSQGTNLKRGRSRLGPSDEPEVTKIELDRLSSVV